MNKLLVSVFLFSMTVSLHAMQGDGAGASGAEVPPAPSTLLDDPHGLVKTAWSERDKLRSGRVKVACKTYHGRRSTVAIIIETGEESADQIDIVTYDFGRGEFVRRVIVDEAERLGVMDLVIKMACDTCDTDDVPECISINELVSELD